MAIVRWLLVIEMVGLATWPFCFLLFRRLPDGGIGLARALGLLLLSYTAWLATSMGIFPYDAASLVSFLVLYICAAAILYHRNRVEMNSFLRERRRVICFEHIFFYALFLVVVLIQAYKPDITLAEKEPDMMFLQAVLKSRVMPPQDLWFAGHTVNYYYLGYVIFASLIKLVAVPPQIGFNLSVASIVPLACVGVFSLAYNITRRRGYALLAPLFLLGLGNLDAFFRALQAGGLVGTDWWYTMFCHGSREVIPGTIHEFPCFSFLLGDLHPHFMFLPFCVIFLTMVFTICKERDNLFEWRYHGGWVLFWVFFAFLLGSVFMLNTWDYPTYLLLFLGVSAIMAWQRRSWRVTRNHLGIAFLVILASVVLFLPFRFNFEPAAKPDLDLVEGAKRSPLGGFLMVNGLACFAMASLLLHSAIQKLREGTFRFKGRVFLVAGAMIAVILGVFFNSAVVGLLSFLLLLASALLMMEKDRPDRFFILALIFLCLVVVLGCEFFYLKDFYGARLQRQNTVFKVYFQAWILSSIIAAWVAMHLVKTLNKVSKWTWVTVFGVLVSVSLIYPVCGTYHRCQRFTSGAGTAAPYVPTLDGAAYVMHRYPEEYEALEWVRKWIPSDKVVLEAAGDPYSFHGRVATFTGRPIVLGWANHESLWRDWGWKVTMERSNDIKTIYETVKKSEVKSLIEKYDISYIYVGTLEEKKYHSAGLDAFTHAFPLVYKNKEVRIYKVEKK